MTDYEQQFNQMKKYHQAANQSAINLTKQNDELKARIAFLEANLTNCQKALDINKDIMRNALAQHNEIMQGYIQEIQELRTEIKRLTNVN